MDPILSLERDIAQTLYRYAQIIDDRDYRAWWRLFTEDGVYSAIDSENYTDQGLTLFTDRGADALQERAAFWLGLWQSQRAKTTHLVSNVMVTPESETSVKASSKFVSYRTDHDGVVKLYASGQYQDQLVRQGGEWKFKSRQVILDCSTLPSSFTDPF